MCPSGRLRARTECGDESPGSRKANVSQPTVRYLQTRGLSYTTLYEPEGVADLAGISWIDPLVDALVAWKRERGHPLVPEHLGSVCQVLFIDSTTPSELGHLRTPRYALDDQGRIRRIDPVFLIGRESLESILRATALGYNGPPASEWLVVEHLAPGFGGATEFTDFIAFLGAIADACAIYQLLPVSGKSQRSRIADVWNGIKYGDERLLAHFWEASQGIATAAELRECVDNMQDRSPAVLCERLSLRNEESGRRLLKLLGYGVHEERDGWQLSHKKKRRKARSKWLRNETRWNGWH